MTMDFTKTLCDLIAIPSISGDEAPIADYIENYLRTNGLDVERDEQDNLTCVVGAGDKILHVNGHMDTVMPVPGWTMDPFTPKVIDGRVYGLGSSDMKGGLAVMMHLATVVKPKVKTVFSFVVCEDGGSPNKQNGTRTLLSKWGGDWAITTEFSVCDGRLTLGLGTQGHVLGRVVVKGKSAHSSRPEDGHNAIYDAARVLHSIDQLNQSYRPVPIGQLASGRASIAATMIDGGTAGSIVPESCLITVSRRITVGEDRATLERELCAMTQGLNAEFTVHGGTPAVATDMDGSLLATARKAYRDLFGPEAYTFERARTDLVLFGEKGMDVLNLGPGSSTAHSADEYSEASNMPKAAALLERIINELE